MSVLVTTGGGKEGEEMDWFLGVPLVLLVVDHSDNSDSEPGELLASRTATNAKIMQSLQCSVTFDLSVGSEMTGMQKTRHIKLS